MFNLRKVNKGTVTFEDQLYYAHELESLDAERVRVSQSKMVPNALAVFERDTLHFICLAQTDYSSPAGGSVFNAIEAEIAREQQAIPSSFEGWVERIKENMDAVADETENGHKLHAMNGLLEVSAQCVKCIAHHVYEESENPFALSECNNADASSGIETPAQ